MYKLTLIALSLFCFKSEAQQRYTLIDRKLKIPIQLTDTITKAQMDKGFFVVETKIIDTLIGKLEQLSARLRRVEIEKYNEVQWRAGATTLTITAIRRSVADRLNVALSTDTGEGHKYRVYIVDGQLTNNDNARYLNRLIKYIKREKS